MVRFGKNKLKALNKLAKKQNTSTGTISNKVIKKKINAEKKVSFQKEVLIREAATESSLVKNITAKELILKEFAKKPAKKENTQTQDVPKRKLKPVEKKKKRQKTQINDTKLLLKLMNSKK